MISKKTNIENIIEYIENPTNLSFNESSDFVNNILKDELLNDNYFDGNVFNIKYYPYKLELLIMLNVKDIVLDQECYTIYNVLINYLKNNSSYVLFSKTIENWLLNNKKINNVIRKTLQEINLTINDVCINMIDEIKDSYFVDSKKLDDIDFIIKQMTNNSFNFEVYKHLSVLDECLETPGVLAFKDKLKDLNIDSLFELYLAEQLTSSEKLSKYFLQKYDYWISFYCDKKKTKEKLSISSKFKKSLDLFKKICALNKYDFSKTKTFESISSKFEN